MSNSGSPSKSMEAGAKDTVVEKLLSIFPAMDREVARSVLITCEYDLAQTVDTLKELGIHKVKESALKEGLEPSSPTSPSAGSSFHNSGRRGSSGSINIPNSPTRGGRSPSPSSSSSSSAAAAGFTSIAAPAPASLRRSHGRSPSTYTFGSSPVSNSYFAHDYQDEGILTHPRGQSPINPYLTATGGSGSRPATASPNPYLPPTNPYLVPPGMGTNAFGGPASPSTRPSFYAYSYSSSPGSVYPIHAQPPSISSPSHIGGGSSGGSGGMSGTPPSGGSGMGMYGMSSTGGGGGGIYGMPPAGSSGRPTQGPSGNPYVFSSSPKISHPQQFPPASMLGGAGASPNPFYTYSYSSSPGSVYPLSAQPGARHPFAAAGGSSGFGSASPGMPHHLSTSPGTAYFASLASTSPAGGRFGGPSSPGGGGGLMFKKESLHTSLDEHLLAKAIKIEDESENESESESDEEQEEEEESVGDNEVVFADEEDLEALKKSASPSSSPSQQKKKKPTIIILRPKHPQTPTHSPAEEGKRQMPNLAQRRFMRLVFKNRTDISPLNPLAALVLCLGQVPALRDFILSDAYKAHLRPEKNKSSPGGAPTSSNPLEEMSALNISGVWDAQDLYHGRRLSLAQHFALCVKALQGKTHNELRELDEQFAAFQQIVTSRTPHLSGHGSVEEEAGRYTELSAWVLEHLMEDFNVKSPAFEPTPEDEAHGDDHVAAKYWESYKRLNPTLLANLFTGLLKTAISCTGCGHRTVSVSVSNGLVLPTSLDKKRSIVVSFVPDNASATNKPTKHSVSVFKTSYGLDLKLGLIERLDKPLRPDQLIVAEVYGGRIAQIIEDSTPVEALKDKDVVVVYEVPAGPLGSFQSRRRMSFPTDKATSPPVGAKSDLPHFVINRYHKQRREDDMGTHIVGKPFPVARNLTYAQLYNVVFDRFKETLGYSKELTYAELAEQIRESEEKRLAGEESTKGREDKRASSVGERHVGPFDIKIVDQFLANCGSCDKGFRCDGCVMPYADVPISIAPESHIVVDWNVPKAEYESRLHKALLLNLWPDKLEETGGVAPKVTLQDCLHKFIGQYMIPEWFCQHCKEFKQATKSTAIGELPPSLIIHLSRFELNRYWHRVCKTEVDFPISGLDLTSYVEETDDGCAEHHKSDHHRKKIIYDLQAVLQLSGNRGYSACVRNRGDHRFYHYTSNATYLLPSEDTDLASLKSILCSGDACVLFYAKRGEHVTN